MSRIRQDRSKSRPLSTHNVDGHLYHMETKQRVFYECHLCLCNKYTLGTSEPFSAQLAMNTIEKNYRKRQSHGECFMVPDRLYIERSKKSRNVPFRNEVNYSEVIDFHQSSTRPEYFALGIETNSGRRYYEVYKCKTADQVRGFQHHIRKARSDPNYRLGDLPVIRQRPFRVDTTRPRSLSVLQVATPREPSFEEVIPAPIMRSAPLPPVSRAAAGVTYLEYDPNEGTHEADFAGRYVFSSNQYQTPLDLKTPNNRNLTYIE